MLKHEVNKQVIKLGYCICLDIIPVYNFTRKACLILYSHRVLQRKFKPISMKGLTYQYISLDIYASAKLTMLGKILVICT